MKARYFFKVLGITIFSLLLLNSFGMAQIHYDNTGKVGIGTTNPEELLHVSGGDILLDNVKMLKSKDSGGIARKILHMTSNDVVRLQNSVGDIAIRANSDDDVYITNSGNVGIGTTSPSSKLEIVGDTRIHDRLRIGENYEGPAWKVGISGQMFQRSGGVALAYETSDKVGIGLWQAGSKLSVLGGVSIGDSTYAKAIAPSEGMIIKGNVGIGTTSPAYKLHVDGDIYATGSVYGANGTADTDWIESGGNVYRVLGNVGIGTTSPSSKLQIKGTIDNDILSVTYEAGVERSMHIKTPSTSSYEAPFVFQTGNAFAFQVDSGEDLVIDHEGNVGIGTTSPEHELDVVGDNSTVVYVQATGTNSSAALALVNNARGWSLRTNGSNGDAFHIRDGYANQERLVINSSGNVGIGTTSPSRKLDVSGNVIANAYENHSDLRLKKNITNIDSALDKVLALRGVEFEWRTEEYPEKGFAEGRKIGLIAQEVEQIIPEVVSTDNEGYKSVEYGNIVSVLIEAIKAQQAQIEELKARIEILEH